MARIEWNDLREVRPDSRSHFSRRFLAWDSRAGRAEFCFWDRDDGVFFLYGDGARYVPVRGATHWADEPEGPR